MPGRCQDSPRCLPAYGGAVLDLWRPDSLSYGSPPPATRQQCLLIDRREEASRISQLVRCPAH